MFHRRKCTTCAICCQWEAVARLHDAPVLGFVSTGVRTALSGLRRSIPYKIAPVLISAGGEIHRAVGTDGAVCKE